MWGHTPMRILVFFIAIIMDKTTFDTIVKHMTEAAEDELGVRGLSEGKNLQFAKIVVRRCIRLMLDEMEHKFKDVF